VTFGSGKLRDRQEVDPPNEAQMPVQPPPQHGGYIPGGAYPSGYGPPIWWAPPVPDGHHRHHHQHRYENDSSSPVHPCRKRSPSLSSDESLLDNSTLTVREWLPTLAAANKNDHDMAEIQRKLESQSYLKMSLGHLLKLPLDRWGPRDGFQFTLAEVLFVHEQLELALPKSKKGSRSRKKHAC